MLNVPSMHQLKAWEPSLQPSEGVFYDYSSFRMNFVELSALAAKKCRVVYFVFGKRSDGIW